MLNLVIKDGFKQASAIVEVLKKLHQLWHSRRKSTFLRKSTKMSYLLGGTVSIIMPSVARLVHAQTVREYAHAQSSKWVDPGK